ncbi:hypothetical protein [Bradyrhizobium yuanmingense]|uniref:hypothetical protein n=1 Tax=Bradyrhizobium yuanmingense TaxID=108015 RepID=UPI0023B9F4FF|nr:hypothetical protein [Bradyrhizobium yuanmingense]MDF0584945.1 hypothetical protein [Bradyrhizobium yuanmingense]
MITNMCPSKYFHQKIDSKLRSSERQIRRLPLRPIQGSASFTGSKLQEGRLVTVTADDLDTNGCVAIT